LFSPSGLTGTKIAMDIAMDLESVALNQYRPQFLNAGANQQLSRKVF